MVSVVEIKLYLYVIIVVVGTYMLIQIPQNPGNYQHKTIKLFLNL